MSAERDRLHFVGSIPLPSAEDVFRDLSREVGPFLKRMPDGETGERTLWIRFQQKMLAEHPAIEPDPTQPPLPVTQSDGTVLRHIQLARLKLDAAWEPNAGLAAPTPSACRSFLPGIAQPPRCWREAAFLGPPVSHSDFAGLI